MGSNHSFLFKKALPDKYAPYDRLFLDFISRFCSSVNQFPLTGSVFYKLIYLFYLIKLKII